MPSALRGTATSQPPLSKVLCIMNESLHQLAGTLRKTYHKKLNDTHIWASVAFEAINVASANTEFLSSETFRVPSRRFDRLKTISRSPERLEEILNEAADKDFNYSIFTFLVAQVEAFLVDLITGVLRIDIRRLKTKVAGVDHTTKIDVATVLELDDYASIIDAIIEKEIGNIFYASPAKQNEYLERVIGIEFTDRLQVLSKSWIEFKATRDLIVHNSGVCNELYLQKTTGFSRWNLGEPVVVDQDYLNSLVAESKSYIGKLCSSIQIQSKA